MAEISGKFVFDDSLQPGQSKDGGLSQNLYNGQGGMVTHASFHPDPEEEDDGSESNELETQDDESPAIDPAVILALLVGIGATVAAPHVVNWWKKSALPGIRQALARVRGSVKPEPQPALASPEELSGAIGVLQSEPTQKMSKAEAEQRLIATLAAAAFVADQLRILGAAEIDHEVPLELGRALEKLSTEQITDSINLMLERDASVLDEATAAQFMKFFGGGQVVDGAYVPIEHEKVQLALRLPDDMGAMAHQPPSGDEEPDTDLS